MLRVWNVSLICGAFALALLGTFLVRSGILQSIHAFGASTVGGPLLALIATVVLGSAALIVSRLDELRSAKRVESLASREAVFLVNNLLLVGLAAVIFWGTFFPLISELFTGERASLAAPWFNRYTTPLAILLVLFTGIGPLLAWRRVSVGALKRILAVPALVGLGTAVALFALTDARSEPGALILFSLAAFSLTALAQEFWRGAAAYRGLGGGSYPRALLALFSRNRRRYGGYVVHAGILVMGIAIAVSATLSSDASATLAPGESISVAGHTVTYDRLVVEPLADDPRVIETRAEIHAGDTSLATALRDYPNSETPIATPVVRTSLGEDLYVTLMAADPATDSVTLRVFVNPLVAWIWLGGGIVLAGAIFAIWPDARPLRVARPASTPATADTTLSALEQEAG
jgi:cytochrome c-type biogenesis protein CcmF